VQKFFQKSRSYLGSLVGSYRRFGTIWRPHRQVVAILRFGSATVSFYGPCSLSACFCGSCSLTASFYNTCTLTARFYGLCSSPPSMIFAQLLHAFMVLGHLLHSLTVHAHCMPSHLLLCFDGSCPFSAAFCSPCSLTAFYSSRLFNSSSELHCKVSMFIAITNDLKVKLSTSVNINSVHMKWQCGKCWSTGLQIRELRLTNVAVPNTNLCVKSM
jgi:hypothetical protein